MHAMTRHLLLGCLLAGSLAVVPVWAAEPAAGEDFTPPMAERLGLPPDFQAHFQRIATGMDRRYTAEQAKANALSILQFEGCHVGGQRLLRKTTMAPTQGRVAGKRCRATDSPKLGLTAGAVWC